MFQLGSLGILATEYIFLESRNKILLEFHTAFHPFRLIGYAIKLGEINLAGVQYHIYFPVCLVRLSDSRGEPPAGGSGIRRSRNVPERYTWPFLLVTAESINIETFNAIPSSSAISIAGDSPLSSGNMSEEVGKGIRIFVLKMESLVAVPHSTTVTD